MPTTNGRCLGLCPSLSPSLGLRLRHRHRQRQRLGHILLNTLRTGRVQQVLQPTERERARETRAGNDNISKQSYMCTTYYRVVGAVWPGVDPRYWLTLCTIKCSMQAEIFVSLYLVSVDVCLLFVCLSEFHKIPFICYNFFLNV